MNCIINYPTFYWTINYLIDQIYINLISVLEKNDGITRRYDKRARWLLRRFNIWNPPPEFIVYRHDLSKRIYSELVKLKEQSPKTLDYVMTRAIEMIFEHIEETEEEIFNREYYLLSVKRYKGFRWRFDRKEDYETDLDSNYEMSYPPYNSNSIELQKEKILMVDKVK